MQKNISLINLGNNTDSVDETEKVIIMEQLDVFKSISELYSYKSGLTNESYSEGLSTNTREDNYKKEIFEEDVMKVDLVKIQNLSECS